MAVIRTRAPSRAVVFAILAVGIVLISVGLLLLRHEGETIVAGSIMERAESLPSPGGAADVWLRVRLELPETPQRFDGTGSFQLTYPIEIAEVSAHHWYGGRVNEFRLGAAELDEIRRRIADKALLVDLLLAGKSHDPEGPQSPYIENGVLQVGWSVALTPEPTQGSLHLAATDAWLFHTIGDTEFAVELNYPSRVGIEIIINRPLYGRVGAAYAFFTGLLMTALALVKLWLDYAAHKREVVEHHSPIEARRHAAATRPDAGNPPETTLHRPRG